MIHGRLPYDMPPYLRGNAAPSQLSPHFYHTMDTEVLQGKNHTAIVGWQPTLNSRGTADIIITCLITISLCIWSALHLNVPGEKGSQFLAKIYWMALALVAPEIVAFTAW
jgi:hypothetical protein